MALSILGAPGELVSVVEVVDALEVGWAGFGAFRAGGFGDFGWWEHGSRFSWDTLGLDQVSYATLSLVRQGEEQV